MIAALATAVALWSSPVPKYWGELNPGPFAVGFTQAWIVDSTRRLPAGEKYGLRYRPVLLNIWYPARATPRAAMAYDDYFAGAVRAAGPAMRSYATALIDYQRATAWRELAQADRDSTEPELARRIDALFSGPSQAHRDAPPGQLSGHVVVYTSGSGSSMDDNVVLCEYLASLGYIVVGSAYPLEDNTGFMTNVTDHSRQRDIPRLLLELARRPGFTPTHVTVVGHSAGAQAMQAFAVDPSAPIDAVLSLDTTQDYAMLTDRTWAYYTDEVLPNRRYATMPIMFVADPSALFELADSLSKSPRTLVTVPDLNHNDFISQGVIRKHLRAGLTGDDTLKRRKAQQSYRSLVEYTGAWIGSHATAQTHPVPAAGGPLSVTFLPVGERSPTIGSDPIRSAREIRHLFGTVAPAEFAARAILAREANPEIASDNVLMMLLVGGLRSKTPERARLAYHELVVRDSSVRRIPERLESRARLFQRIGASELATEWRTLRGQLIDSLRLP